MAREARNSARGSPGRPSLRRLRFPGSPGASRATCWGAENPHPGAEPRAGRAGQAASGAAGPAPRLLMPPGREQDCFFPVRRVGAREEGVGEWKGE